MPAGASDRTADGRYATSAETEYPDALVQAEPELAEDGGSHRGPIAHEHVVVEAQRVEPEPRGDGVPHEILVPRFRRVRMSEHPVHFEYQPIAEDEVDAADAGDLDLLTEMNAVGVQPESQDRLQPTGRIAPCELQHPPVSLGHASRQPQLIVG